MKTYFLKAAPLPDILTRTAFLELRFHFCLHSRQATGSDQLVKHTYIDMKYSHTLIKYLKLFVEMKNILFARKNSCFRNQKGKSVLYTPFGFRRYIYCYQVPAKCITIYVASI